MRTPFTGAGTALITPFTRSGDLDEAAVRRLGRRQIDAGIHFLAPCGTTGENPTLTALESRRIVEILAEEAVESAHSCWTGANATKEAIELSRAAKQLGADGMLQVTPYYNKPTQEGQYRHFKAIAEAVGDKPIILYNVPGRTGVNVDVPTLVRLAAIPNIIGVKEASGSMQQMCEICRAVPSGFLVLSGDDAMALPLMAVGGRGVISVISNQMPGEVAQMIEAAERDDLRRRAPFITASCR